MARASKVVATAIIAATIFGVVAVLLFIGYAKLNDRSPNPLTYLTCTTEVRVESSILREASSASSIRTATELPKTRRYEFMHRGQSPEDYLPRGRCFSGTILGIMMRRSPQLRRLSRDTF
jgi:hypothetical protein